MDEEETREVRLEDEQQRILTLKVNLEGPAEMVSWMKENVPPRMGRRMFRFLPEDFRRHMRAARREQLLAVRSLLDAAIQRLEPTEEKPARRAKEVEIQ